MYIVENHSLFKILLIYWKDFEQMFVLCLTDQYVVLKDVT